MITGAGILVVGFNWLEPLALALGNWGKVTIPMMLGISPWPVIVAYLAGAIVVFWLIATREARS
jgi:hypothetical protein